MVSNMNLCLRLGLLVVFMAMSITIGGYHLQAKALKADNARLEQAAAAAEIWAQSLQKELEFNYMALAEREQKRAELAAETEALRNELSELYANNEPCAVWADGAIPGPILDRLR